MQRSKVRAASAGLLLAATLVLSACTGSGAFPSATPTPSVSAKVVKHSATDRGRIATTYEAFLNGLYSLDEQQQAQVSRLYQQYPSRADFQKLSAKQQANVVATLRELDPALSALDVTGLDVEQKFLIYAELLALGASGSPTTDNSSAQVSVAEADIAVKGSSASVPLSALTVSVDGAKPVAYPSDAPIVAQAMPFEKVANRWLIDAKALAAQGAALASAAPTPSASGN